MGGWERRGLFVASGSRCKGKKKERKKKGEKPEINAKARPKLGPAVLERERAKEGTGEASGALPRLPGQARAGTAKPWKPNSPPKPKQSGQVFLLARLECSKDI